MTSVVMAHNTRGCRFAEHLGMTLEVRCPRYVMIDGQAGERRRYGKILPA